MSKAAPLLFLLLVLLQKPGTEGKSYTLNLKEKIIYPDGVRKNALLFNDAFPGPLILAEKGEQLQIAVTNNLRDPTSVHWHGFFQNGTQFEDGPSMVTQCPLIPGHSQKHVFFATRAGTFWYHSHYKSQYTDGLVGPMVVRDPEDPSRYGYDDEFILLLDDWYHTTHKENLQFFMEQGALPLPFSALINGRGAFPCSSFTSVRQRTHGSPLITPDCFEEKQSRSVFRVLPGKTYRIRVINTSSMSSFLFSVDGHKLRVIETDGVSAVTGDPIDYVVIATGQRYSFLLQANQPPNRGTNRFFIRSVMQPNSKQNNGAYSKQDGAYSKQDGSYSKQDGSYSKPNINANAEETMRPVATAVLVYDPSSPKQVQEGWEKISFTEYDNYSQEKSRRPDPQFLDDLKVLPLNKVPAPEKVDAQFTVNIKMANTNPPRTSFDGRPFVIPKSEPQLFTVMKGNDLPPQQNPIRVKFLQTVEIVINNNQSRSHPIHLHGHNFYAVGRGLPNAGRFDPRRDPLSIWTVKRDVIILHEKSWVVVRFLADNPGVWSLHCHIDWHNVGGMVMTLVEGQEYLLSKTPQIPAEAERICKLYNGGGGHHAENPAPTSQDWSRSISRPANPPRRSHSPPTFEKDSSRLNDALRFDGNTVRDGVIMNRQGGNDSEVDNGDNNDVLPQEGLGIEPDGSTDKRTRDHPSTVLNSFPEGQNIYSSSNDYINLPDDDLPQNK